MSLQSVAKTSARIHSNRDGSALVGDLNRVPEEPVGFVAVPSTALGPSPSSLPSAVSARDRSCSQGLVGPSFDQGGSFISPHFLEYNSKNSVFVCKTTMESKRDEVSLQEEDVAKVRRFFPDDKNSQNPTTRLQAAGELSSSPDLYLICSSSKDRSETSCSSESQGSLGGLNEAAECGVQSPSSNLALSPVATRQQPSWPSEYVSLAINSKYSTPPDEPLSSAILADVADRAGECDEQLHSLPDDSPKKTTRTKPVPPPKQQREQGSSGQSYSYPSSPGSGPLSPGKLSPLPTSPLHCSPQCSQTSPQFSPPPSSSSSSSSSGLSRRFTGADFLASQREKAISFLDIKAGEDGGKFDVDYLGSKELDKYIKSVNSITKQLMAERPREMVVYVSSEKVRLAPPNSATLYQSLAVKDILWVRKCSRNKHVVAVVVWKSVHQKPICHILRCRDIVKAKRLFDTLWEQTQKVDEIMDGQGQSPSRGCGSEQSDPRSSYILRPISINSVTSSEDGSVTPAPPTSVTEILHQFPSVYIGSTTSIVKSNNIDDVISKVMSECRPSEARSVTVALSLSEVQLFDRTTRPTSSPSEEEEKILSHETSRVRFTGVFSEDRRFCGYVIKEVGKPQEGHVIRCNSAALMTSFTSFLRQSCQLTSPQRGGSFYDEISTDESDEWDCSAEQHSGATGSLRFVHRIKSLTCSITQFSASSLHSTSSPTSLLQPRPTFQSHMLVEPTSPSPATTDSESVQIPGGSTILPSPFDFSDEEYAKFQVTYLGSATQDYTLSQHSVEDALYQFSNKGTSGGQAAVVKNTISLQVSSLGINLTDKSKKLFINRNYPLKTIIGFCQHYSDNKHFAFATERPGFPNVKKVHVFQCLSVPPEQVISAMQYWLQMDPVVSGPIPQNQEQ